MNKKKLTGYEACVEGAIKVGCRFMSTYPIFPGIEIENYFLKRAKEVDAVYVQMEDEIAALACVLGAVWTGKKGMTVTSGPGFSLMMEHIGLACMLEVPCVIVEVQRLGPSEGNYEIPAQSDIMQGRWGSHGDYEIIAVAPSNPQEMFDYTVKAFNLAEKYRVPVMVMVDEIVGKMEEEVEIGEEIEVEERFYYKGEKEKYLPYQYDEEKLIPPMVDIGKGYRFHVTGLTHDERGYPVMNEKCQEKCVRRLVDKIRKKSDEIIEVKEENLQNEVVVITYGSNVKLVESLPNVGKFILKTLWPFPEERVKEISKKAKKLLVVERNYGQIFHEVKRCNYGKAEVKLFSLLERKEEELLQEV